MTAPLVTDEPYVPSHRLGPNVVEPPMDSLQERVEDPLRDRVSRLEEELHEVRKTVGELAGIVVGEIKERRATTPSTDHETSNAVAALVPGLGTTLKVARQLDRPWLLLDLFRECITALRMYLDSRYRVRRSTQIMVPALLLSFFGMYVLFNWIFVFPVISHLLERFIDIVLAVLLYKVVSREIGRYRQAIAEFVAASQGTVTVPVQIVHHDADSSAMERQGVE